MVRIFILLLISLLLTSCMLAGPNFHRPAPPCTCQYTECPTPTKTVNIKAAGKAGKTQHFVVCEDLPGEWWRVFHSPEINCLIQAGLAKSPNLAAAKAALLEAQKNYLAQVGTLFPSVTANYSAERQRFSAAEFGGSGSGRGSTIFNLFNANVSVAYTLDIFGGLRRQIEAAGAQADYQRYELEAAFLTLSSNIVTTVITMASLRAQITATQALIQEQEKTVTIVKQQFQLGGASEVDVLTQVNQLEQFRASLPPLQQKLVQNAHALSVLIGELPCQDQLPILDLDKIHLPANLPLSLPSLLTRQRPDVKAAEALLHVASANIGVATANLFPQVTMTGEYGWLNTILSSLTEPQNKIWNIAGAIAQPIFQGGSLVAKRSASIAAYQQAAAVYRQTVLQAFQNVADTLRALQNDAKLLKAQRAAEIAAERSLQIARKQLKLGGINYLELLIIERSYRQALIGRIQAQAARYTDTAALFQALGGGWWNRCSLERDPSLKCNVQQYRPEYRG